MNATRSVLGCWAMALSTWTCGCIVQSGEEATGASLKPGLTTDAEGTVEKVVDLGNGDGCVLFLREGDPGSAGILDGIVDPRCQWAASVRGSGRRVRLTPADTVALASAPALARRFGPARYELLVGIIDDESLSDAQFFASYVQTERVGGCDSGWSAHVVVIPELPAGIAATANAAFKAAEGEENRDTPLLAPDPEQAELVRQGRVVGYTSSRVYGADLDYMGWMQHDFWLDPTGRLVHTREYVHYEYAWSSYVCFDSGACDVIQTGPDQFASTCK
jgi:hypothetical protein